MIVFTAAFAQTFVTTPGTVRSFEIEAWSTQRTERHPWGTDWNVPEFEAWAGILDCTMGEKRFETCVWRDQALYWAHGANPSAMTTLKFEFPGQMEVKWGPRGNLASWDVRGDGRERFWEQAANGQLKALFHRSDVQYTKASIQDIGTRIEEAVLKSTIGWIEVHWPKQAESPWAAQAPITGVRRYGSGVATHKLQYRILPDGRWVMEGKVVESAANGGAVETMAAAVYVWDGDRLAGMVGESVAVSSTAILSGHIRNMVEMRTADATSDPRPDRLPEKLMP